MSLCVPFFEIDMTTIAAKNGITHNHMTSMGFDHSRENSPVITDC